MSDQNTISVLLQQNKMLLDKVCEILEENKSIKKQLNDLHTIVMSKPITKTNNQKIKKPTKKEQLAMILEKRAFNNVTKSN